MKKKIIRINDISEIDTSKISVYDLNNRYVDPKGNLFGLKYDRLSRKVEIIKLERMLASEIQQIQKKLLHNKEVDSTKSDDLYNEPIAKSEEAFFEPEIFIKEIIENSEVHRQRLSAIMMNLDMSDVFRRENKVESNALDYLERHLDIDCIQQLEKLENYHRELTSYPRSVTYYQAKVDNEGKKIIDSLLVSKKDKVMKFIYYYEMAATIKRVYSTILKYLLSLQELLANKNADDIPNLTKQHKQAFNDAKISLENTIKEVEEILNKAKNLHNYAINKNNY